MNVHLTSDEVDLWKFYETNRNIVEAELQVQLSKVFTPEVEVGVALYSGSLYVKLVAMVKDAVNALRVNISAVTRSITTAIQNALAKTQKWVNSPSAQV
jgi:tRNA pseudouridine-54 N-methylase